MRHDAPIWNFSVTRINGEITTKTYWSMLPSLALPAIFDLMGEDFILQKDNCSVQVARSTPNFVEEKGICLPDWPARSQDLNILENVWSMLNETVPTVKLCEKLGDAVLAVSLYKQKRLMTLYDSLPKCIVELLQKNLFLSCFSNRDAVVRENLMRFQSVLSGQSA